MAGTDFSHLTNDELINGIQALNIPDYIRSKAHGIDVRETLAQMTEMTIQLGVNLGLSPEDALLWARKLQETVSQSDFDSWVATLLDGGPSIFMNTLSELQTTYPNGAPGVALVRETDPAKIYVWNGTAWEDFGDYQGIEVKDLAITTNKLADKSITQNKTAYLMAEGIPSKNLFDKTAVTSGYYVSHSNGTLVPSTSYNVSEWIPVVPNQEYILHRPNNTANDIAFYSDRNEESYVSGISVASEPFTVPDNVHFLRMSVANIFLDLQMLEEGTVKNSYENGLPKVKLSEEQNYKINNSLLQRSIIESSNVGGAGANSGAIDFTNKQLIRRVGSPIGTGTSNGSEIYFTHPIDGQLLKGDTIRVFVSVEASEGMFPRGIEDYDFRLVAVENGETIQNIRKNIIKTSNNLTYTISGEYDVKSSSESIRPVFTLINIDIPTTEQTLTVTDVWYEVDSNSEFTGSSKVLNDLIREYEYPMFANGSVDEIGTIGKDILNVHVENIYNVSIGIEKKNSQGYYYNHYFVSNATGVNNSKVATRGMFQVDVSDTDRVKLTKTTSSETAVVEAVYSLGGSAQVPYESKRSPMILSGTAQKERDLNRIAVYDYANNTLYATVVDDGQNILQTSNDLGGTFEPKYTFTDDIKRALALDNGNVLVLLKDDSLWISTDNMVSFTNNMNFVDESPHEYFGFSKYKHIVTFAPYAVKAQGSIKGKRAYVSYDSGETFTEMFNLLDYTDINQATTHIHSSTYDPYEDIFWVCAGDGQGQQMVYYSKDGTNWHRVTKQGTLEFQATIIIPLRNSVLFVSDTRLVGVVRYVRPVGGTVAGSELKFDQPLIIAENWGSGSMDVPIASVPYIDWEKSIAYFSWIVTSGGDPGRQTAIGNKLLNGEVWTTNGDDFKLIYKRTEPERVNNIYGIVGGGDNIISRSHYSIGEILDTKDVWQ